MKYKLVTAQQIIAKVYRQFRPNNNAWVIDAYEYIGEGLLMMGLNCGYEHEPVPVNISQYKAIIPCFVDEILGVEFEGNKLPLLQSLNAYQRDNYKPISEGKWYNLKPNVIETSFEEGCIILHTLSLPLDRNGYPKVPDVEYVKEALSWLILARMISSGYKHSVFNYAESWANWEKFSCKGKNKMKMPSLDEMENFKNRWTSICNHNREEKQFFNALGDYPKVQEYQSFKESQRTIVHVEDSDEDLQLSSSIS